MVRQKGAKNGCIKGEELLSFASVKKWIISLEQCAVNRGKPFTSEAKRQRLGRLLEFTTFSQLDPDQLLAEAKIDIDVTGKRLTDYIQHKVKKGVEWNTAVTNIAFIRGFYTHNDVVFPKRLGTPDRKVSAVSKRDTKTEIYGYDEENGEIVFHNGNLQHFVQNLNFRDQTIALCLLSTGADAADLLKLKVHFVKDAKGQILKVKRFLWHDNRAKDGVEFKTFFSEEATQFLKRYVEQERSSADDKEYLFAKEDGSQLPTHALAINFRVAATKMGLAVDDESNPFRPKRFRHLFRTACSNAGIDNGFVMAMMGHASDISAGYLEKSDGLFLKEYVKVEPYLTVFGVNKGAVTELSEEVNSLTTRQSEMEKTVQDSKDKVIDLYSKLEEKTNQVNTLESEVKRLKEKTDFLDKYIGLTDVVETKEDAERLLNVLETLRKEKMAKQ